jgi:hypothetical protein
MMRSSVLSDKTVIDEIKKNFIAIELNITDDGFPKDVPALKPWETAYNANKLYTVAFATSTVIGPTGKWFFGDSGSGHGHQAETAVNYHPDLFLKYLATCRERYQRALAIESDKALSEMQRKLKLAALQAEILKSVHENAEKAKKK